MAFRAVHLLAVKKPRTKANTIAIVISAAINGIQIKKNPSSRARISVKIAPIAAANKMISKGFQIRLKGELTRFASRSSRLNPIAFNDSQ